MSEQLAQLVVAAVKKAGAIRTSDLAARIGWDGANDALDRAISAKVPAGTLITCAVQAGGVKATEYRLSALAGGREVIFLTAGRPGRLPDPVVERLREWGTPPQPKSAVTRQVPQAARPGRSAASAIKAPAAPAQVDQDAPPPSVRKRLEARVAVERASTRQPTRTTQLILDALEKHGPSTPRELEDAGLQVGYLSTLCRALAMRGKLRLLVENPKCRIYGLLRHTLADRARSESLAPPGPIERGVPIPPRRYRPNRREYVDALRELQPGECRRLPFSTYDVASICADAGLRGKFAMRTAPEGGVRVWRTKA